MTTELKNCPFCGGGAHIEMHIDLPGWEIQCNNCGASVFDLIEDKALAAWNTRTADKEIERLREALRPFAAVADQLNPNCGENVSVALMPGCTIKAGHLRAARQALGDDE